MYEADRIAIRKAIGWSAILCMLAALIQALT